MLGEEQGAEAKVSRFRTRSAAQPDVLQALKQAQEAGTPARDLIHRALLATHSGYAQAYGEYAKTGENVATWQTLLEQVPAEQEALTAHASYFLGRALLNRDELDQAAAILEDARGRLALGLPWADEVNLHLGYVYARGESVANTARARVLLAGLPDDLDAPERIRESAAWIMRELSGEGRGPLLELALQMDAIERLVRHTKTGETTQKKQEQVVATLDKLIELMREKEGG